MREVSRTVENPKTNGKENGGVVSGYTDDLRRPAPASEHMPLTIDIDIVHLEMLLTNIVSQKIQTGVKDASSTNTR